MAGNASRQNGILGGRPKGRKSNKTLEKEAAEVLPISRTKGIPKAR